MTAPIKGAFSTTATDGLGGITYWCARCGKQMGTPGGCVCPVIPLPLPQPQYGWICPKCGRANAPFTASCGCTMPHVYHTFP